MINYKCDVKKVTFIKKVISMREFLEKTLRQNVIMTENKEVYKKLPLAYRGRYDIFTVMVYYGWSNFPKDVQVLRVMTS